MTVVSTKRNLSVQTNSPRVLAGRYHFIAAIISSLSKGCERVDTIALRSTVLGSFDVWPSSLVNLWIDGFVKELLFRG